MNDLVKAEYKGLTLYEKLFVIQKSVRGLKKDTNGGTYKYVSGSKIIDIIKDYMNDLGIVLKQEVTNLENTRIDYLVQLSKNDEGDWKGKPKTEILTKTEQKFTWIDIESEKTLECVFAANGMNDFEKGLGSALTYAERYFLLKFFHIPTDEDDVDNPGRKEEENKKVEKNTEKSSDTSRAIEKIKQRCIEKGKEFKKEDVEGKNIDELREYYKQI